MYDSATTKPVGMPATGTYRLDVERSAVDFATRQMFGPGNPKRDKHIASPDSLDVQKHPMIELRPTGFRQESGHAHHLTKARGVAGRRLSSVIAAAALDES